MKKKRQRLGALLLTGALFAAFLPAAPRASAYTPSQGSSNSAATAQATKLWPITADNAGEQNYKTYGKTISSYLFENLDGTLSRIEEKNDFLFVETYDSGFSLRGRTILANELSYWIGAFSGKTANYLFFGAGNGWESNAAEVIRIVKYSKDWKRLSDLSIYGANTVTPADFCSLRCIEVGDYIYVHTGHKMYKSSDGLNHQSNMTFFFSQQMNDDAIILHGGYTSHSFNQFLLENEKGEIVLLDHGDANPRSIVMSKCHYDDDPKFYAYADRQDAVQRVTVEKLAGKSGDNETGASVGGFTLTDKGYLVSYNYDNGTGGVRTPYLAFCPTEGDSFTRRQIPISCEGTPILAPIDDTRGYVLLEDDASNYFYYASYNAQGELGTVQRAEGSLSDCPPILYNGKITWYAGNEKSPVFYQLGQNGVTATSTEFTLPFTDLAEQRASVVEAVKWALKNEVTTGTSQTTFSPEAICTRAQVLTFLWRAKGCPEPVTTQNPFHDVSPQHYFYKPVLWGVENGIVSGTSATTFSPDDTCKTAHILTFIWRSVGEPERDTGYQFWRKYDAGAYYAAAMDWAYNNYIYGDEFVVNSRDSHTDAPRGEVVGYLHRLELHQKPYSEFYGVAQPAAEPTRTLTGAQLAITKEQQEVQQRYSYGLRELRLSREYLRPSKPAYYGAVCETDVWGGKTPDITYEIRDPSIAKIEGNRVVALRPGFTSLLARATLPSGTKVEVSASVVCVGEQDVVNSIDYPEYHYNPLDKKLELAVLQKPTSTEGLNLTIGKSGGDYGYYGYDDTTYEEFWPSGSHVVLKLSQDGTVDVDGTFTPEQSSFNALVLMIANSSDDIFIPYQPNTPLHISGKIDLEYLRRNNVQNSMISFMLAQNYKPNSGVYAGASFLFANPFLAWDGPKYKLDIRLRD